MYNWCQLEVTFLPKKIDEMVRHTPHGKASETIII